jgi:hypothetical protein
LTPALRPRRDILPGLQGLCLKGRSSRESITLRIADL